MAGAGLALAVALGYLGAQAGTAPPAFAATSQFHGVNWADPNDNFITGPNIPVGLSQTDSYATTYTKATAILKGFQSLGVNTVRFGINAATTSSTWWNSYTAAFDAATALGMNVIIAPWLQGGTVSDTTSFYQMWDTVINKYGGSSNFYFDIMNEPYAYSATNLTNFEAAWLARYPSLPRGRIIVPGTFSDNNLCAEGADSRLAGTLLSIHIYSMFGDSHTTEAAWVSDFESNLCGYASRAVVTEFGAPMTTGVNYDGPKDGTNDISYLYAITDTARSLGIGTVLWVGVKQATQTVGPGPCENASCAITSLNSSGTAESITNQSGLDRLQYGWGISSNAGGGGSSGTGTARCCAASARTGAWTCLACPRPTGPCWTSGTATAAPTSSGPTCRTANCRSTAASASTCRAAPQRQAPGWRSGPATVAPTSSGPSTPTARSSAAGRGSAWTSPARAPRTGPRWKSGPATAAATSTGPGSKPGPNALRDRPPGGAGVGSGDGGGLRVGGRGAAALEQDGRYLGQLVGAVVEPGRAVPP